MPVPVQTQNNLCHFQGAYHRRADDAPLRNKILTILPPTIHNVARRKLRMIAAAKEVKDLRIPPGNKFEQLAGTLAGLWSIRINDQWRIVFAFENGGAENVRITDYH